MNKVAIERYGVDVWYGSSVPKNSSNPSEKGVSYCKAMAYLFAYAVCAQINTSDTLPCRCMTSACFDLGEESHEKVCMSQSLHPRTVPDTPKT